jgi:hypothetical protein
MPIEYRADAGTKYSRRRIVTGRSEFPQSRIWYEFDLFGETIPADPRWKNESLPLTVHAVAASM